MESYATELKVEIAFLSGVSAFSSAGWHQNRFAGIDGRMYGGFGAGYAFLDGPHNFLVGELAVNYVNDTYTNDTGRDYPEGRAFGKYTYAFTDKTRMFQSLEFLGDLGDTVKYRLNSETAISVGLSGNLSLKTSYLVGYVHEPTPDTLKKTNATALVTLVLTY